MSPAEGAERWFRDATLALAAQADFARPMVNSGRLSVPCTYPLDAPDDPRLPHGARPGVVAPDAPLEDGWLIDALGGELTLLVVGWDVPTADGLRVVRLQATPVLEERYCGGAGRAVYLVRPDQVVAARWVAPEAAQIDRAVAAIREGRA